MSEPQHKYKLGRQGDGLLVIGYERFGHLRLRQFLPAKAITRLEDWEFLGRTWLGEAAGFSEWLRLADDPDVLRSLALDFNTFPARAATRVLGAVGLDLRKGMRVADLENELGRPRKTLRFVPDRRTYEFLTAGRERFVISCTVLEKDGLTYLGIMVPRKRFPVGRKRRLLSNTALQTDGRVGRSTPSRVRR